MRVRYKDKPESTGFAFEFNTHGLGEIIVDFDDGDMTSEEIKLLEVYLERPLESSVYKPGVWVSMRDAFKSHDLIPDNYNTCFMEPQTEEDKTRGYYL